MAVETAAGDVDPAAGLAALEREKERTYGETTIWLYRAVERSEGR